MTIRQRRIALVAGSFLVAVIWSGTLQKIGAQSAATPISFTSAQASEGHAVYVEQCASCHGKYLDDGEFARPLKGVDFRARWGARSTEALFTYLSTKMPPDRPGTLGDARYAQLLAFILQENGAQPGERELPAEPYGFKEMAPPNWPAVQGGGVVGAFATRRARCVLHGGLLPHRRIRSRVSQRCITGALRTLLPIMRGTWM